MVFIVFPSYMLTLTSGLTQGETVELHRRQRIIDLDKVIRNLRDCLVA